MKLIKTDFNKYKSIIDESLDIERDITCLVGINEAGKTNVLNALQKIDTSEVLKKEDFARHDDNFGDTDVSPTLKLSFIPADQAEKLVLSNLLGVNADVIVMTKKQGTYTLNYPAIDVIKSSLNISNEVSASEIEDIESVEDEENETEECEIKPEKQPVKTSKNSTKKALTTEEEGLIRQKVTQEILRTHIPNFLFFDSVNFNDYYLPENGEVVISEFLADPEKMQPIKNLLILGGITDFKKLIATDENERIRRDKLMGVVSNEINKRILQVIWPVKTVGINLSAEGDILKIRLQEKGKTSPFKPGERSRGLQWALAFNIYFLAEVQNKLKGSVLLIDEPGVFLHVNAQKHLLEDTFEQIAKWGSQIIYTTHLPYLINSKYPERIRILEKEKEDTKIGNKAWSEGAFSLMPEPVKTALGLQWSEILNMGETNLLVEGPSDQIILREMYRILSPETMPTIIPTYGDDKMPTALALVKVEGKKGLGILDRDSDITALRQRIEIVGIIPEAVMFLKDAINDEHVHSIEDIIPEDIYKNAVFSVYEPICKRRPNCTALKIEEIPLNKPRVVSIEQFFATKFSAKKHNLLKMEIARAVKELMAEHSNKAELRTVWESSEPLINWFQSNV